jgi:hypothetical protein
MPSEEIISMSKKIVEMREKTAEAKTIYEEIKQQKDDLELNLHQQMEIEGVQNFKLDGVGKFYKSARPYASVVDTEKAQEYFKSQGIFDEVFQLKPTARRLNEFVKENFINKKVSIPEDEIGISVKLTPTIGLRRS